MNKDKLLGALYGLLIGDAAGVPYEFKNADAIPVGAPFDDLDVPPGYNRTYGFLKPGTWSDDGSQTLCLLESLLEHEEFNADAFGYKLIRWKDAGYYAVDNFRFDIGIQTNKYLTALQYGHPAPIANEHMNGNGSLMRTLPVALVYKGQTLVDQIARKQSEVTHPHDLSMNTCALYCHLARWLLQGQSKDEALELAISDLKACTVYTDTVQPVLEGENYELMGSGYVVDSFWSAYAAFRLGTSYRDVIRRAIAYGDDTDTTAAIAGGLAGAYYGLSEIPESFMQALRGKELVEPLAQKLLQRHGL